MHSDLPTPHTEAPAGPCLVQPGLRWAVLDLMGHRAIAGAVSYEQVGDVRLVRVDVPEVRTADIHIPAHPRSLGAAAIFSIAWCDEAAAVAAAHVILHRPPSSQPHGNAPGARHG